MRAVTFSRSGGPDAIEVIELPDIVPAIPAEQLTTLGMNALTAWQAVAVSGASQGSTVVVSGASGAVGGYAALRPHGRVVLSFAPISHSRT